MHKTILITALVICYFTSMAQHTKLFDFDLETSGSSPYSNFCSVGDYLFCTTPKPPLSSINDGTIFKIKKDGSEFLTIHEFTNETTGSRPGGALIYFENNLYGVTRYGGIYDSGVLFKIKPNGSDYIVIHNFESSNGSLPSGNVLHHDLFLYGMTESGGINSDGVIYKIKPDGSEFSVLYNFKQDTTGFMPLGSLITDGTYLYGMTTGGGINNSGTIFKIKSDGTDYAKLLDFSSTSGHLPYGSLSLYNDYLYGMTRLGNIFRIKTDGTEFSNIYNFDIVDLHGTLLVVGNELIGTTFNGGQFNYGSIFKINPDGTNYHQIHEFTDSINGVLTCDMLYFENNVLYGMTTGGGINKDGTVFKIDLVLENINTVYSSIEVYPTSTTGIVHFKGEANQIDVINNYGQVVKSISTNDINTYIDISDLTNGFYLLKFKYGNNYILKKIIKR